MARSPMVGIRRRRGTKTSPVYPKHTFPQAQYYPSDWGKSSLELIQFSEKAILDLISDHRNGKNNSGVTLWSISVLGKFLESR